MILHLDLTTESLSLDACFVPLARDKMVLTVTSAFKTAHAAVGFLRQCHIYKVSGILYIYNLVGPVAARHPYKKRCSEGGRGGWQGGWRGSPLFGATNGKS